RPRQSRRQEPRKRLPALPPPQRLGLPPGGQGARHADGRGQAGRRVRLGGRSAPEYDPRAEGYQVGGDDAGGGALTVHSYIRHKFMHIFFEGRASGAFYLH
ncbi:hypothetical protein T310_7682, partial [Rasamsonia emersonii CBS 393.64]